LLGVGSIIVLQLAFTYTPVMQWLFDTRPMALMDGLLVIGVGVLLFVLLEIEKLLRRYVMPYLRKPRLPVRLNLPH